MKFLSFIQTFAFWGICFLLILTIGFGVRIQDIFYIAVSLETNLAAFCLYLLVSVGLFPLFTIIIGIVHGKSGLSFGESLAIDLPVLLWTPYKGLDFRGRLKKNSGFDSQFVFHDIGIRIWRFIEMIIWWTIVIGGLFSIYVQYDNAIRFAIDQKSSIEKLKIIGIALIVYIVLRLISWIINKVCTNSWKEEGYRPPSYEQGTKAEQYYRQHSERKPVGCRACGGPYPECKLSCNLFDD